MQCGLEGKYFLGAFGADAYAPIFAAWCALREMAPYNSISQMIRPELRMRMAAWRNTSLG
jgi:hypothetical protein